jgi:hypothetical protein
MLLTLLLKGDLKKSKFSDWRFFWLATCVNDTVGAVNMCCVYRREFSKKFEMILMGFSGTGEKLIHEKNLKSNISWHCPFNAN